MTNALVSATDGPGVQIDVTPDSAGWRYLSFAVVNLTAGAGHTGRRPGQETAIVPLRGSGSVTAGDHTFDIGRTSVFAMMEPFLPKLMARSGINFQRAGEDVDYHGLRAPYFIRTEWALDDMLVDLRELYDAILKRVGQDFPKN